jgi:hypothetical protein
MFLPNKCRNILIAFLLLLMAADNVCASDIPLWVDSKGGVAHLKMADGSLYDLALFPDVAGVFYDRIKHNVHDGLYVSILQVSPSNPDKPLGFCGAGSEVWLYVYKVMGAELGAQARVLVSSCLSLVSLSSQNSGEENQDSNFSSVQWGENGFSIDWFYNIDATGRLLSSTNYIWRDGIFLPREVLSKDALGK